MASELSGRERIWRALHHQEADRVGIMDTVWDSTLERWYGEGLSKDHALDEQFGYDMLQIRPDLTLRFPTVTVEDTDEYTIVRDYNGALVKNWKHSTSTPGWLDHAIKTRADWEEHKWRLAWEGSRIDWDAARRSYEQGRSRGQFIYYAGAICWDGAVKAVSADGTMSEEITFSIRRRTDKK